MIPHQRPRHPAPSGLRRIAAAGAGATLLAGIGFTAAAFTDAATVNLGSGAPGSGVGDPRTFDIAILDASGATQDAPDAGSAVDLPFTPGTQLAEDEPVELTARVLNRATSITGDLLLRVYDPTPGAPWEELRFTVYLDDATEPAISNATATAVNAADLGFHSVSPGDEHQVRLSITLAAGTSAALAGTTGSVGLRFDGESR